jgi:hypothetical protein
LAKSTSLTKAGPTPAFVLAHASGTGVGVAAFVRYQQPTAGGMAAAHMLATSRLLIYRSAVQQGPQ